MNTPRIEEILKELWELMPDDVARGGNETFYDTQIEPKLRRALTQAHQAGIDEEKNRIWSALCDLAEPDERQIGAGDLKTHLDDVHKIIFITKP